jgi:hypothetical protein
LSGISTALVFQCRQPVGVFTFLAVVLFFLYLFILNQITASELKKYLLNYIIGNILISLIFIVWLVANHAFIDWWEQSILLPILWALGQHASGNVVVNANMGSVVNNISIVGINVSAGRGISINNIGPIFYLVRVILYGWPIFFICMFIKNYKKSIIALLIFISLASGIQFYPAHDIRHCYWGGTIMIGVIALAVYQFVEYCFSRGFPGVNKKNVEYITAIVLIVIFLPLTSIFIREGLKKISKKYYFVEKPKVLKGIRLTQEEANFYTSVYSTIEKYFNNNPEGNVISKGDAIFLTFDPRIINFHPMYVNWGYLNKLIYPDYPSQLGRHIVIHKPLILEFMIYPLKRDNV